MLHSLHEDYSNEFDNVYWNMSISCTIAAVLCDIKLFFVPVSVLPAELDGWQKSSFQK